VNRKKALLLGLGCGGLSLSCCVCMVFFSFRGRAMQDEFGALSQACDGRPVPGAGAYPVAAPLLAGVRRQSDGTWRYDALAAPNAYEAPTRAATSVVMCLEAEVEVEDPPCFFTNIVMETHSHRRSHRSMQARLIAASTGAVLHAAEIVAPTPACVTGSFVPDEGYEFEGDSVGRTEIQSFVEAWLATRPR
jgi:hypothetical protein